MTAPGAVVVLVFGESRQERFRTQLMLRNAGYRVRLASSRAEAAKAIAAGDVGVVLLLTEAPGGGEDSTLDATLSPGIPRVRIGNDPERALEVVRTTLASA